ncbi:signal peptide peptidase SppA [Psychromonas ossibalaenae]|uniref:signal peptide peptidase SppA n=1 Tax=Psychromonas ossibalaenae TaxID=444922 RepID=UPI00037BF116|nr:signal peptide peptidase SppA [Psychromonas ossibalaenae]
MKLLFSWLKSLAKLINLTRLFIINAVFIVLIAIIVVALNVDDQTIHISDNSTLHLNLNGIIVEQKNPVNFAAELSSQMLSGEQQQIKEYQVDEVIQAIRHAQNDPKINDILLELNSLSGASINHLTDIGKALNDFKSSGKKVTAISDNYSQAQYLLASYADQIYLNPQGMVLLQGYSVYRLYFKEALDNLLITPHVFKVGTYKSFVEPFTDNQMSKASKLANKHWLNQLWKDYIDTVVTQRSHSSLISVQSVSPSLQELKAALKKVDGDAALYAQQAGLVDHLNNRYEIISKLQDNADLSGHKLNLVDYSNYQSTLPKLYSPKGNSNQIALIHGSGEILAGSQDVGAIGGVSFSKLLDNALQNKNIKAVVIRLDTPGGSAFASEKIRQQVLALKQADKKVVVSMGSVTASGGYWIASAADSIVASPTTLTGSIGIFGMFASADKALNKFGIYNDGVGTTELSTLNPTRALNPELGEIIQLGIEHGYQQFLTVVSEGRGMTVAEVNKVAQGRVWTGSDAQNLGLVDKIGGLQDAINEAAVLADLKQYDIKVITPAVSAKQQFINEMFSSNVQQLGKSLQLNPTILETLDSLQSQAAVFTKFNDPQGRYAYCPMCIIK